MDKNCLTCKHFVSCTNPKRKYDFVCVKYKPKLVTSISLDDFGDKGTSSDRFKFDPEKQEDFDIFSLIDSLTDSENVLPRDVKIDDRDIPQASNFFEFATDPRFLAVTPFPKQVEVASNYFNEICWKCSNKEWKKGFPTHCTMEDIRENIQFFDKGVCPKCGRRKSVQIRKGKLRPYVQMAGLAGQRCVVGSTEFLLSFGKSMTFDSLFSLHENIEGFQTYKGPEILVHTGLTFELVKPSLFYYQKNQDVYTIKIKERYTLYNEFKIPYERTITCTPEHPLLCMYLDGTTSWVKLKELVNIKHKITGIVSVDFDFIKNEYSSTVISVCPISSIEYAGKQDVFDIEVPVYHNFIGNNLVNHNSGKSATFDMMEAYRLHWCMKIPKLAQFYGLLPSSQLHTSYIALTFGQAKETIYDTLYDYLTTSPWWKSYTEMLDYYGNRYGEELYTIKDTYFRFRTQSITGYPAGPDRRKLRGRCLAGNVLVYTDKGLIKASNKFNLVGAKTIKGNTTPLIIKHKKQNIKKNVVRLTLDNGVFIDVSDDHRIPIFENNSLVLKEAKYLLNTWVVCQVPNFKLNKQFSRTFCSVEKALLFQQKQFYKGVYCLRKDKTVYWDCDEKHFLIPNTSAYVSSTLNTTHNIRVPSHLLPYMDNGYVFVKVIDIKQLGLKTVYDIEVDSKDHLFTANGVLVHNTRISGACVSGDTLLNTNYGIIPIKDILGPNSLVDVNIGVKSNNKAASIIRVAKMGVKPRIKIVLTNGMELKCSTDHRVFTLKGKKQAQDLTENDYIIVDKSIVDIKKLPLNYAVPEPKNEYAQCLRNVKYKNKFTYAEFIEGFTGNKNSPYNLITRFKRNGWLIKKFEGKTCYYTKTKLYPKNIDKDYESKYAKWDCIFPKYMCPELAYIIGMFISDGNYFYKDREMCITTTTKKLLNKIRRYTKEVFNYDVPFTYCSAEYNRKRGIYNTKDVWCIRFSFKNVRDFFRHIGLKEGSFSLNKEVPWSIMKADNESKRAFIQGLFDGDGTTDGQSFVCYSSTSKKVIKQVQLILLSLGYISKFNPDEKVHKIVCDTYRHNSKFENFVKASNYICLFIKGIYYNKFVDEIGFTHRKLKHYYNYRQSKNIIELGNNEVAIKVHKLKKLRPKMVYNLTVDSKTHSYWSNGMVSKNCDEIGWFLAAQAGTIKYDVDEVHKAMLNSFKTVHAATRKLYEQGYDNVLNPILANISSPSSVNDKIMRLYEQSKTSHYIYGWRYTSWEFNPTLSEDDFLDEKINQPKEFMRDYMTIPPLSSNPYLEDIEQVGACLTNVENAFTLSTDRVITKSGRTMSSAKINRKWVNKSNKILALDAGLNNNSFAICLAHNEEIEINGIKHLFPVYDCLAEAIPEKNCPINFSSMYNNVIKPIIEDYGVKMVVADRWNSAKVLDDIETDFGIPVETYSVKYIDFSTFKEMILNNQVKLPKCEGSYKNVSTDVVDYPFGFIGKPIQHFILQCITVQDYGDKSVTKGPGYTDDIFRATILANSYLTDKDYKKLFIGETAKRTGGAVGSRGGDSYSTLNSNLGSRPTGFSNSTSYISRG